MKRRGKILVILLAAAAAVPVTGVFYACAARSALEREIAETPRDPATGIIQGTEPLTLAGTGERACLLIHGWLGSRIDFHDLPARLHEQGLTVRMMLIAGHGTTPKDLAARTVEDYLESVRAEYAALEQSFDEVTVIGFSLGGALATLLASEEDVARLVLVAPFFEVTYRPYYVLSPETWNAMLRPFLDYVIKGKAFVRVNREEAKAHIFSYRTVPTASVSALCDAGRRARSPGVLQEVTCPVLVLHARGDMAACPDAARAAYERMGAARKTFVVFERSNHHLLWDFDGPEAAKRIVDFVVDGMGGGK